MANNIFVSGNDVYVAGYEENNVRVAVAKYWKNGTATTLTNGTNSAVCFAFTISGNDIYAAGFESYSGFQGAKYWKNNVAVSFNTGIKASAIYGISIVGNDVYAGGYESNFATYWINGVPTYLTDGTYMASANAIYVK